MRVGVPGLEFLLGDAHLRAGVVSTRNNSDSGTPQQMVPCFLVRTPLGRGTRLRQVQFALPGLAAGQETTRLENQLHASSQVGLAKSLPALPGCGSLAMVLRAPNYSIFPGFLSSTGLPVDTWGLRSPSKT